MSESIEELKQRLMNRYVERAKIRKAKSIEQKSSDKKQKFNSQKEETEMKKSICEKCKHCLRYDGDGITDENIQNIKIRTSGMNKNDALIAYYGTPGAKCKIIDMYMHDVQECNRFEKRKIIK